MNESNLNLQRLTRNDFVSLSPAVSLLLLLPYLVVLAYYHAIQAFRGAVIRLLFLSTITEMNAVGDLPMKEGMKEGILQLYGDCWVFQRDGLLSEKKMPDPATQ